MKYESEAQVGAMALDADIRQANKLAPTLKSRLEYAVAEAEARLAEAKRAREILNAHPELEELLNIMQRGRF